MGPEELDASTTGASSTPAATPDTAAQADVPSDKGYVDAVMSALKPEEGSQPSKVDQKTNKPDANAPVEGEQPKAEGVEDPTEEELKNYSPHARKRIGQLLGQRKEARELSESLQREVEPLKAQAKIAGDLQSFVQSHGLTKEDLDTGFSIMGMMRGDPQQALNALMPIVSALQERVGNVLPADLLSDVQAGKLNVERALELSRSRAANARSQETAAERAEAERQQREQQQFQSTVQSAATAVSDWERTKSTSDPDWHLKQDRIGQLVELEVRRSGFPQTSQAAVALHQRALDTVNAELRKLRPAPKPMNMATGHANPNSVVEPKSHLEAAMMGLQRARSG